MLSDVCEVTSEWEGVIADNSLRSLLVMAAVLKHGPSITVTQAEKPLKFISIVAILFEFTHAFLLYMVNLFLGK